LREFQGQAVRLDNLGMAKLFELHLLRANEASSAATEMRKTIGVKKSTLSEKIDRFIYIYYT